MKLYYPNPNSQGKEINRGRRKLLQSSQIRGLSPLDRRGNRAGIFDDTSHKEPSTAVGQESRCDMKTSIEAKVSPIVAVHESAERIFVVEGRLGNKMPLDKRNV
jgi:hypothetical protein